MDVRAVLVMLAVLMPLLQASGETVNVNVNIGDNAGGSGTADKSQDTVIAELLKQTEGLHLDPATGTWQSQLDILDMSDTGRDMVTALLLQQNKKMQEQIKELQERDKDVADLKNQVKDLALDLCHTKMTCCNKTLTCPSGYERFCERPDMCYKFSTNEKNYTDARSSCQAAGGHLAMPKDKATNDLLHKQAKARYTPVPYVWMGLTDEVHEGTWMWEDETPLGTGWNNWNLDPPALHVPLNDPSSNCALFSFGSVWYDESCRGRLSYICEVKATAAY